MTDVRGAAASAVPVPDADVAAVAARLATLLGHELRNPLGTILTGARALQLRAAPEDADTQRLLGAIVRASETALAQAVLARDYAQAALAGAVPVTRHAAELGAIVAAAVKRAAAGGGRSVVVEGEVRCEGVWDAARLEQALAVLVGEVAGAVTVRVEGEGEVARVVIVGEAVGEAEGERARLERFVAERIVAAHGGAVRAVAEDGGGWVVELPKG